MNCSLRERDFQFKVSDSAFCLMGKFVIYWEKFKGKKLRDFLGLCFSATISSENMYPFRQFIHVRNLLVCIAILTGNTCSCMMPVHQQIYDT